MKVIIMGCGRVGAWLAGLLDADGHSVTILDIDSYSFRRLNFPKSLLSRENKQNLNFEKGLLT